ncbi:RING finger and CHY zinc finger domain-containing protein 1-like [Diachasmimorpha longicaudata]|uniref:RING finger and CHY zinc finger domain-containing protein 1-like n=1 Tax=Diachasmimorpha longicaudata TaxID=58733 RepID=UPI0030B89605
MATAIGYDGYGCEHYKRKSRFVTPCCKKVYTCRFCHDEMEQHPLNRKSIKELVCIVCEKRQPVGRCCRYCFTQFGMYACLKCNFFEDEDRGQFHCTECGICRVGYRHRFFHCPTCNLCLPRQIEGIHKCIQNVSHDNCPVCLEDLHSSRLAAHIPSCGHLLHTPCYDKLIAAGMKACPTCQGELDDVTKKVTDLFGRFKC